MNLYKKLLEAKKKVPYLKKDKRGFNYTYVTPSKVLAEINPILNDLGILLETHVIDSKSYPIEIETKNGKKTEWKFDLDFIFNWVDVDDNERISIPWKASGVNGEDKGLGSALTYAERYFMLKQFNIPTDEDDPDNFQDKHMTDAEKKAKADAEKKAAEEKAAAELAALKPAAISEMQSATDLKTGQVIWTKYKSLQQDADFIAAKESMKLKFPANATATT